MTSMSREQTIESFAGLLPDWDSYGAEPFNERTIELALEVSAGLADEWYAVPVAEGPSVMFYRRGEPGSIQVCATEAK